MFCPVTEGQCSSQIIHGEIAKVSLDESEPAGAYPGLFLHLAQIQESQPTNGAQKDPNLNIFLLFLVEGLDFC